MDKGNPANKPTDGADSWDEFLGTPGSEIPWATDENTPRTHEHVWEKFREEEGARSRSVWEQCVGCLGQRKRKFSLKTKKPHKRIQFWVSEAERLADEKQRAEDQELDWCGMCNDYRTRRHVRYHQGSDEEDDEE